MSKEERFENLKEEQFDEYKKFCEVIGLLRKSKFIVGYNEDGDAMEVLPGIKSTIVDSGKGSIPTDLVCKLMEKGKTKIDIKTTKTLCVHGSPVCCIPTVMWGWICIC
ncbi:MAG: hypothetical protein KAI50_01295 [Desulfobacterales bacterium]|nr:hypothetical protein [Desulfobacterales bacterium]